MNPVGSARVVVAVGVGTGLLGAGWLGRFIEGFLHRGVTPDHPTTLAVVCPFLVPP